MHLTEKSIAKLVAGKTRKQYPDDSLSGFGLRITPSGERTFYWHIKVQQRHYFKTLGALPAMTLGDARTKAQEWAGIAAKWRADGFPQPNPLEPAPRVVRTGVPTFQELVDAYVQQHVHSTDPDERANHPETAEYRVRYLSKQFAAILNKPLNQIIANDILKIKQTISPDGIKRKYLANRCIELARALFNWSGKPDNNAQINFYKMPQGNPADEIKTFGGEESRERILQPAEVSRFNACLADEPNTDLKDFLILAMATGARKGDILSMRWQDVSIESARWTVPFPKGGEAYNVDLRKAAIEVLERREAERIEDASFVFPGVGKQGHVLDLKKAWSEFRLRAQIPDVHIHDLRRTVGSYAAMGGASLQQIGAMLGHRSIQSTQVYARLCDSATRETRELGERKMLELMAAATKRAKTVKTRRAKLTAGKTQRALRA
jgi:integrase